MPTSPRKQIDESDSLQQHINVSLEQSTRSSRAVACLQPRVRLACSVITKGLGYGFISVWSW